ncbi:MAG TPA: hypothetical protein VHS55_03700 [Solirubrobacteraceae bacterium]|jgi:hypothetical protein|nr:hypothetical protein [Solirubrobacteraceae bacterium]
MAVQHKRVSVGFQGGQVLSLRVTDEQLQALYRALGDGGWHGLESEDGPVRIYLGQVVYVRLDEGDQHVGFSA